MWTESYIDQLEATRVIKKVTICLKSEETTQLRRMATWEKGPTTEPRTRDLRLNAEFQPREPRNPGVGRRSVTDSVARVCHYLLATGKLLYLQYLRVMGVCAYVETTR